MATLKAINSTLIDAGGLSTLLSGLVDGRVKCMLDSYVIGGSAETSGSTLDIGGNLPKGANVIAIVLSVSANQTSATFDVGDDEDADRYAAASTSLQTAGTYVISGKNYVVDMTTVATPDNRIVLTTGGATLSAGTLYTAVLYSID